MNALSARECEEILEYFRLRHLDFPDGLLQELANNYGLDAPCDIDPLDIVEVVSRPGPFDVLTANIASQEQADAGLSDLLTEAEAKGMKVGTVGGALLVVKQTDMRFNTFVSMHRRLMDTLHPTRAILLQAMYCDSRLAGGVHLKLILTGINMLEVFVGPRERRP
jgi:hypothetical protein